MNKILLMGLPKILCRFLLVFLLLGVCQYEVSASASAPQLKSIGRLDIGLEKIQSPRQTYAPRAISQSEDGIAASVMCNEYDKNTYSSDYGTNIAEKYFWSWCYPDNIIEEDSLTVLKYSSNNTYFYFYKDNSAPAFEAIKIHLDPSSTNNASVRAVWADFDEGDLYYSDTQIVADYDNNLIYWKPDQEYDLNNIFFYVESGEINMIGFDIYSEGNTPEDFLSDTNIRPLKAPVFQPESCEFTTPMEVEILAEEGAKIYYTTDGNYPTIHESYKYNGPVVISATTTFYAIAADKYGNTSPMVSAKYTRTLFGIGEDYNPPSPGNPGPTSPEEDVKKYELTVVTNPYGAGSSYANTYKLAAGSQTYVYTYNNTGFVFSNWTIEGEEVSKSTGFYYVMPEYDVTIVANYSYNPVSPGNPSPEEQKVQHPVVVRAIPSSAASVSPSGTFYMNENTSRYVYAYPQTGWELKGWTINGEQQEQTSSPLQITMEEKALDVAAYFTYNPSSPVNPGANYYNPITGQVIIDDFTRGNLYSTLRNLVDDFSKVRSLIVKGEMGANDFGNFNYLKNAETIDISRTGGITSIPGYAFYGIAASGLVLPSTISSLDYNVFGDCQNLSSITIYSQEPPVCNRSTFTNFTNKDNCVIYVPASAVGLYSEADYWKDFSILPIVSDVCVLQVNLPDDASDGRYKNNTLEIRNLKSGVKQKYVISDRLLYTFSNLQKGEQFNIYMYTRSGFEIGRIENVVIPDQDIEVTFDQLKSLYSVSAKVTTPEGKDVTSDVTVEWLNPLEDDQAAYLRKGVSLDEIPEGQELVCRVTLNDKLGTTYVQPEDTQFVFDGSQNTCVVNLVPFRRIELSGTVLAQDEMALDGASVSINQTLNGKFTKSYTAKTDRNGKWEATVLDAPQTHLTFAATEYVNANDTIDAFASEVSKLDVGVKSLKSIVGAKITYGFTYYEAGYDEPKDYYSDYKNVAISVFNVTQDRTCEDLSIQYPVLAILDENINSADQLRLIAISKTGSFNPLEKEIVVDEDKTASVIFDIVGKGGVSASFEMTENPAVIAMLYNSNGELQEVGEYSDAKLEFVGLEDGEYILVTIGKSDLMSSILRLSNLDEIGLVEGKDYVKNNFTVEAGKLTEVRNPEIPAFDESLFYYTSSSTRFTSNKSSLTTGNYLTLISSIDFKGAYKDDISNVNLVVDLPENCDFVEQSVINTTKLLPYTIENNRLLIPLESIYQNQTRFCVFPTCGGTLNVSASVIFDYKGKTVTQPIGTAVSEVKDMEINVPSVLASPTFTVSGTALAKSVVKIKENGIVLGKGEANGSGAWNIECDLGNPRNLSTHPIYAEITTPSKSIMVSETKELTYDKNAIQVYKVTMYHWNPEMSKTFVSEFDFLNPKTRATQWTVYYPKKKFTYTIEFTRNDPELISNVILYVHTADGQYVPCDAVYDENKGLWYAEIDMGTSSNGYYPVNCSVDFDFYTPAYGDSGAANNALNNLQTDLEPSETLIELVNNYDQDNSTQNRDALFEYLGIEPHEADLESSNLDDFLADIDDIILAIESTSEGGVFSYEDIDGNSESFIYDYMRDVTLSSEELADYEEIELTDGSKLYIRHDNGVVYVYFDNCLISLGDEVSQQNPVLYAMGTPADEFFTKWNQMKTTIQMLNYLPKAKEILDKLNLAVIIDKLNAKYEQACFWYDQWANDKMTPKQKEQFNPRKARKLKEQLPGQIDKLTKVLSRLRTLFKAIDIAAIINDIDTAIESRRTWNYYIESLEESDCPGTDELAAKARSYRDWVAVGYTANLTISVTECTVSDKALGAIVSYVAKAAFAAELSGAALAGWIEALSLFINDVGIIQGGLNQWNDIRWQTEIQNQIPTLKCPKDCGEPGMPPCPKPKNPSPNGKNGNGGKHKSGSPGDNVQIDPSGFVYESVPSNRVEGVQATIYYKEIKEDMYGDPYEEIILWDAEEYAQQNPLFTDENGLYRWDVPQGLWQVKFEKDGYQTTYSEWLPVPPPQLEVNIGIVQYKQPEVIEARAYEEGIEVQFDKFMDESTLTSANIFVTANGEKLSGEITLLDSTLADEYALEDDPEAQHYTSRVRFVPEQKLGVTTGEILLTVSRNVLSYVGIPMTETYSQVLDVEKEVQVIAADDVKVLYGEEKEIVVYALPFEAAVGRTLRIANSSDLITSVDKTEAEIDEEGKATIIVKGDLPGRSQLTFSIDDVTITGSCEIDVVTEIINAEAPKSSRASGTAVYRGTKVELTTDTKDGVIYFTTDGSCPCDENGTRRKYTVPIIISDDTRIIAMTAVGTDSDDTSETVEFNYTLKRSDMDFEMEQGWSWISHNFEAPVAAQVLASDENISRIMSQTQEVIRDPQLGMIGTLQELKASESYKVETTSPTSRQRISDIAWNPSTPIALNSGWNWLGYPLSQTMTLDEALAPTKVENLDVIVGQSGFAQFDGEKWVGTLETLTPGIGYMYQSQSAKDLVYNTSIVSIANSQKVVGISDKSPLTVDIHKYRTIMPMVITLKSSDGFTLDNSDYRVNAFCGTECRGIGRIVNGLVMMNVYGNVGDQISFVVTDYDGEVQYANSNSLSLSENIIGSLFAPYEVSINEKSAINEVSYQGGIKVSLVGDMLQISGVSVNTINMVEVYGIDGRKLIRQTNVSESGINVSKLPTDVYIVVVNCNGEYTYHKIAIR